MYLNNNTDACKHCSNNPANNPHASGFCLCVIPYMTPPISIPSVWQMDGRIQPDTITTTNANASEWLYNPSTESWEARQWI
jgi:hypothetical protein